MNSLASKLEEAIMLAVKMHEGQLNVVTGDPYVLHSLRVMNRVKRAGGDQEAMIVGVLHDAYKHSPHLLDGLDCKFNSRIAGALKILTRVADMSYDNFIWLVKNNTYSDLTVIVKLASIADNLAQGRDNPMPEPRQSQLTARYKKAQKFLLEQQAIYRKRNHEFG